MPRKWLLLFLVHAGTKQTRDLVKSLTKMLRSTQYNEEVKVLVLYSGLQYSTAEGLKGQVTLRELIQDKKTGQLNLHEVSHDYGNMDMGNDKRLKRMFSHIRTNYPSERFLLFTWDHGSGFGIFEADPRKRGFGIENVFLDFEMDIMKLDNNLPVPLAKRDIQFNIVSNYAFENDAGRQGLVKTSEAEKKIFKTTMLTNDELRNTIKHGPNAKKVDLLIMMNCMMQMVETGYAFHDTVEYLVAPETCIFWAGYNYKAIINKLCGNPEIETEEIGKYAIDTIQEYYQHTISKDYFDDLVVSLVKPAKSLDVKEVIDEIAKHLKDILGYSFDRIKTIRQECNDVTTKYLENEPYYYLDFLNSIARLTEAADKIEMGKVKEAMRQYVVHIIKGNNYSNVNTETNIGDVNGCSIYYPPDSGKADHDRYYEWFYKSGNHQTLFATECLWQDFLVSYFKHDRNSKKKTNDQ